MTAHLLQLAIGPVQEFIAAARRTRDLWFGSCLLSEISEAAAKAVQDQKGKLIFPDGIADRTPDKEAVTIANIIVAELPSGDPKIIAEQARNAAQAHWEKFARSVFKEYREVIRPTIWDQQVKDIIEFYAAWVPFTPETYAAQRKLLARLVAGRKNCRDFRQASGQDAGRPKSSLDGLRETVFLDGDRKEWPPRIRRRLHVRPGEQLDAVGLVKRTAEGLRPYPSVSRIAADPWLRGVAGSNEAKASLARLREVCDRLCQEDLLHKIKPERLHEDYKLFPFEGTAVYRTRHHEILEELKDSRESEQILADLRQALAAVEAAARKLGLGGEPNPYLAILVADGDKMGEAICKLAKPEDHRRFSRKLAGFATEAEQIVRRQHGVLVYSGGDDVLAFLPLDKALTCARELHKAFADTMQDAIQGGDQKRPTLSVGVAIGHFNEHLEDLLGYGRAAEKAAKKPDRDGLAVHLHKRGGVPVHIRGKWEAKLDVFLMEAAGWFLGKTVSNRTPYELHRLAEVYEDWPADTLAAAIEADAIRVIDRKRPPEIVNQMEQIRQAIQERVRNVEELRRLADELLIARQLAEALRQSGEKSA